MPLNILATSDSAQLLTTLRAVDISVPGRIRGRTTDHTETWTIARLLATLTVANRLAFPLTVAHRDRPDVLIQSNDTKIGVEVTEAISQQYAAYCALAEREFPSVFLEPAHFRWGAPGTSVQQMRNLLSQSQLSSDGWVGDRPEREWALFVVSIVDAKLAKLARGDFDKFDQNWLAVYDNLPLPNVHLGRAIGMLRPLLQDRWSRNPGFDTLCIERGPVIARITSDGSEHLVLNNLWE
jgi:hypothetical protein